MSVYDFYFLAFIAMISLCFFFLPYTFFYAEEKLESDEGDLDLEFDFDEEETPESGKCNQWSEYFLCCFSSKNSNENKASKFLENSTKALKATLVFLGCLCALAMVSYLLSKTKFDDNTTKEMVIEQWKKEILDKD